MHLTPWLVFFFYKAWSALWRMRIIEHPDVSALLKRGESVILAHWHGDEYSVFHLVTRYSLATMTSTSRDGEIIDFLIHKLGGATSRGSSTRGGVGALKGLVRLSRAGRTVSIAVDGPRGPIYQPKPGVFELSKLSSAHIVPVGVAVNSFALFKKSWNQAYLPWPWAKVVVYLGQPLPPLTETDTPKDIKHPLVLKSRLTAAKQQAAEILATL